MYRLINNTSYKIEKIFHQELPEFSADGPGRVCVQAVAWRTRMSAGKQQHPQSAGLGTPRPPCVYMIASPGSPMALIL